MGRRSTGHDEDSVVFENVRVLEERDKALKVSIFIDGGAHGGQRVCWIPKSQITDDSEVWADGDEGAISITKWIARQKDLIDD